MYSQNCGDGERELRNMRVSHQKLSQIPFCDVSALKGGACQVKKKETVKESKRKKGEMTHGAVLCAQI